MNKVQITSDKFDAVLFDMDGVVTRTAAVHYAAWKKTFDEFLKAKTNDSREFSKEDYLKYVDGKPREDGVQSFLQSRHIDLPIGEVSDTAGFSTIYALANQKNDEFLDLLRGKGVEPYETTIALIKSLRDQGIKTGLVTASKNGHEILEVANIAHLFDTEVTGTQTAELGLHGKPAPDTFLQAAKNLKVDPSRAVVVEDAEAGVEAGKRGQFALVIGVAREDNKSALMKHGASVVVSDLAEVIASSKLPKTAKVEDMPGMAMADLDVTEANWCIEYNEYVPAEEKRRESLCTLGNGYFFTRGAACESIVDDDHYPATYLAGTYNDLEVAQEQVKFSREELVNMPNWLYLTFKIGDDDWFSINDVEVLKFSQRLNLREGMFYRTIRFKDKNSRECEIKERRFVHMQDVHLGGLELQIHALNFDEDITIRSGIDGSVQNSGNDSADPTGHKHRHLDIVKKTVNEKSLALNVRTTSSHVSLSLCAKTTVQAEQGLSFVRSGSEENDLLTEDFSAHLQAGRSIRIRKICALYSSKDLGIYEPESAALEAVENCLDFDDLVDRQIASWRSLWRQFDLFLETSEEHSKIIPSLLLHLNSFHCLQTASGNTVDLDQGVPARGWTGEGYQGHVFWDDLFIFPFINFRMPQVSASLLKYRYRRLPAAREIAKQYGARGACFPWQSASDGKERTPAYWWMPEKSQWVPDYTSSEIHVNGAIAYNVWQYYQVTLDNQFMYAYGAEILLEIARFFASYAKFNEEKGRYEIKQVIGPDEFHNAYPKSEKHGVDNNAYTNILAAWTLQRAVELLDRMPWDHKKHISCRLSISNEEIQLWKEVAKTLYLPIMDNGLLAQFDGYAELAEFPLPMADDGFAEKLQELLKANAGYLNQYKMSKQADVLMLGFLFNADELAELAEQLSYPVSCVDLEKLVEYYLPRTANQSTLSRVAHTWVVSRVARIRARANKFNASSKFPDEQSIFYEALGSDYFDVASRGTTSSGIHMGAMAGTVDIVQRCYTGLTLRDDVLWFDPFLPKALKRLSFNLHYRGQTLSVDVFRERLQISAGHSSALPIKLGFDKKTFELNQGEQRTFKLTAQAWDRNYSRERGRRDGPLDRIA